MGVFRSSDNGDTWQNVLSDMSTYLHSFITINDLEVSSNTLLAATSSGVFISTNHGEDWTKSTGTSTDALAVRENVVIALGPSVIRP